MQCFLCLKDTDALCAIGNIRLDSKEAILSGIPYIIEKHFWLQINNVPVARHIICAQCWRSLYTFHKFYLEVETAHSALGEVDKLAENDINDRECKTITENAAPPETVIKQEILRISTPSPLPIKRTSSRLKDKSLAAAEKINKQKMLFVLEEINLNEIKIEIPEADITMADVLENDDAEFDQHKTTLNTSDIETHQDAIKYNTKPKRKYIKKKKSAKVKPVKPIRSGVANKIQKMKLDDEVLSRSNFKLLCNICSEQFPDFTKLAGHFRKEHQKRGYAVCCNKKFFKRCTLIDHLHQHENPEYFKCHICDKVLGERRSLELHMQLHNMKKMGRNYKCEQCDKSYYNHKIYLRHQLTHVPDELRTVSCTQCDKHFPDKYAMQQHVALVHLKKYAKICDVCGKAIHGKDALARHMQEHAGVERELVQCDMCGVKLTTKYGLARHKKMMHMAENRQPKQCPICFKTSPSLQSYLTHVKYMHNLERKHQCPMCEKAFKRKPDLREHMTTHTGDVLYTCPHCPKTFNSNANMHSHRKKMHRKEWEENRLRRYHHASISKQTIKSLSEHITLTKRNANVTAEVVAETVAETNT